MTLHSLAVIPCTILIATTKSVLCHPLQSFAGHCQRLQKSAPNLRYLFLRPTYVWDGEFHMDLEDHAMRISESRYENERQQHAVALRFLEHEARTQTFRAWTGLTDDRFRRLYSAYLVRAGSPAVRHRGKSPQQAAYFWRTASVRQEAAWLASLFLLFGLIKNDKLSRT